MGRLIKQRSKRSKGRANTSVHGTGRSRLEATLEQHLRAFSIDYEREYRFHPSRRWRFDFALHDHRIAIECEGGHWSGGRHVRGDGFENDCEKYNAAVVAGWRVLRFTWNTIRSGEAIATILELVREKPP